jgi:hypothetical protein
MTETENPVDELRRHEQAIGGYIKQLKTYAQATEKMSLHFLPTMRQTPAGTQIVVQIINFGDLEDETPGATQGEMDAVPAAYFYEAYRKHLPDILTEAIKHAEGSLEEKAKEAKAYIQSQKKALAVADKELDRYLKTKGRASRERSAAAVNMNTGTAATGTASAT